MAWMTFLSCFWRHMITSALGLPTDERGKDRDVDLRVLVKKTLVVDETGVSSRVLARL
jgi:hypothetical protein